MKNLTDIIDIYTGGEEIGYGTLWEVSRIKSSILFEILIRHVVEM